MLESFTRTALALSPWIILLVSLSLVSTVDPSADKSIVCQVKVLTGMLYPTIPLAHSTSYGSWTQPSYQRPTQLPLSHALITSLAPRSSNSAPHHQCYSLKPLLPRELFPQTRSLQNDVVLPFIPLSLSHHSPQLSHISCKHNIRAFIRR